MKRSTDYYPGGASDHEDCRRVHSSSFLNRLGCLSEQSFRGKKCKLVVNDKFTITEFQDGGHKKASSATSIRVNGARTISLNPEMIGTVLKFDFVGLPVPRMVTADRVLSSGVVKPEKRDEAWRKNEGFLIEAFRHSFRQYVAQRGPQLFILESPSTAFISAAKAYALKEEHLNHVKYNWAEDRADHIHRGISNACGKGGRDDLSTSVKAILASYIGAALPLLGGLEQSSDPHHGKSGKKRSQNLQGAGASSLRRNLKDDPTSTSPRTSSDQNTESGQQGCKLQEGYAPSVEHSGSDNEEEEDTHCNRNDYSPAESKPFLRRLGCLTEQMKINFKGRKCDLEVSDEYTICGFHDGGSSDEARSSSSSIQVDCIRTGAQALSLEPEMIGEVLGIEFEGLRVPSQVRAKRVLQVVSPEKRAEARCGKNGFKCSSFPLDFQAYIAQRQKQLCLPMGNISAARADCLAQEFFEHAKFNWAKERADYILQAVRTGVRETGNLAPAAKSILSTYIAAALSLLKGGLRRSDDTDVQQQPRRSSRNMSKRKQTNRCEDRKPKTKKTKKARLTKATPPSMSRAEAEVARDAAPAAVHLDQRIGNGPHDERAQINGRHDIPRVEIKDTNFLLKCVETLSAVAGGVASVLKMVELTKLEEKLGRGGIMPA